jgi:DNA-binding NarL/FixJ family response regulator
MLSILVLEDNRYLCKYFSETLLNWHLAKKVQTCSSNAAARALIESEKFDIVLVDLNLDDGDGSDTIALVSQTNPDALVIVISGVSEPARIVRAIRNGAVGYILKTDNPVQLVTSIEKALSGQSPISPAIAMILCKSLHANPSGAVSSPAEGILTKREAEVINLVARGLSNSEIAEILEISKNTLPVHIRNIYRKLQTTNRTGAVFEARILGILD